MNKNIWLITLIMLVASFASAQSSIYSLQVNKLGGGVIHFSDYAGKKILLVNIATGGDRASQLAGLEEFYQAHKDSIVVIGFPSNSFGHEANSNQELESTLGPVVSFPVAVLSVVANGTMHPVYQWITNKQSNGVFGSVIKGDFQKYLVNRSGLPIGIFTGPVLVSSEEFLGAIGY